MSKGRPWVPELGVLLCILLGVRPPEGEPPISGAVGEESRPIRTREPCVNTEPGLRHTQDHGFVPSRTDVLS